MTRGMLVLLAVSGCHAGTLPVRAEARAAVLALAQGLRAADAMCARQALASRDANLAEFCAGEYMRARESLLGAERALDDDELARAACEAAPAAPALAAMGSRITGKPAAAMTDALAMSRRLAELLPCGGRHDAG